MPEPLRAAVIGLDNDGQMLIKQLAAHPGYLLTAVGDRDMDHVSQVAAQYQVNGYDDYRSLIVRDKLDILFLMAPSFQCGEAIQGAAKNGLHVVKRWPLARSQPEANAWVEAMRNARRNFYIFAPWRFLPVTQKVRQYLTEQAIGLLYLVRAETVANFSENLDWRGDPVLAGGGVLLEMGYGLLDQIVGGLGAPGRVYAMTSSCCSKRVLPPSRTEDTANLIIRYGEGIHVVLTCGWMSVPASERILYHGTQGAMEAQPDRLTLWDADGRVVRQETFPADHADLVQRQLTNIAESLHHPEVKPLSPASDHLLNMAIVESAYLSSRTQMPEHLKIYGSMIAVD